MDLLTYLLKVSTCTVLFFAFYLLVLRKLTFFKINRFYLLLTLLLSFVIPALNFTIEREVDFAPTAYTENEITTEVMMGEPIAPIAKVVPMAIVQKSFDYYSLLPYLYFAVVFSLLVIASWRILRLMKHTRGKSHQLNGLKIVKKSTGFTNCSFFNYVFIDKHLTEPELQILLKHEEVHAKQLHSIDKLILMIVKAVLWFNPVVYLYDNALEQAHEYEADAATSACYGSQQYANLLLRLAVTKSEMPLVHNFVKSPIKERIKMLFRSKSKHMKKLMYLLALPIGLGLLWSFTVDVVEVSTKAANEKEFTLILDAGHGGKESGGNINGYKEKDITLAFTKKIKALAEANGINVIATRTSDESLSLADRLKPQGDFLLSIHVNSEPTANNGSKNGIEMYTPTSDRNLNWFKSTSMTYNLYKNLTAIQGIKTGNKPFQKKLFLLQNSTAAGLVLEMGYLTNKQDLQTITNEAKQNELAEAIVNAILQYKAELKTDQEIEMNLKGGAVPEPPKPTQNVPLIKKTSMNYKDGKVGEKIVITVNGKIFPNIYSSSVGQAKVYFYINQKLYSEAEAMKFTPAFIAKLSGKSGIGNLKSTYEIPGIENSIGNFVVWFGVEPKLSAYAVKNKSIYEKYNGKTIDGKVIDYTYSSVSNAMDGFIIKTTTGETVKASVEEKFAKQTEAMIAKGDEISIKIYNANYRENTPFPMIKSYKLMKGNRVLFDRWPKVTTTKENRTIGNVIDKNKGGILENVNNPLKPASTSAYIVNKSPEVENPTFSAAYKLLSKLKANNDSLKMDVIAGQTLLLIGNVKLNVDDFALAAKFMVAKRSTNIITAHIATITDKNGNKISGDIIELDLISKNYKVTKAVGAAYFN